MRTLHSLIAIAIAIGFILVGDMRHRACAGAWYSTEPASRQTPLPDYSVITNQLPKAATKRAQLHAPGVFEIIAPPDIPTSGTIIIAGGGHMGGSIRAHEAQINAAIARGQNVVIDDACWSACTNWLRVPADKICATERAVFGFHWATNMLTGAPMKAETARLFSLLPAHVRAAITRAGGLGPNDIRIKAIDLVRKCSGD